MKTSRWNFTPSWRSCSANSLACASTSPRKASRPTWSTGRLAKRRLSRTRDTLRRLFTASDAASYAASQSTAELRASLGDLEQVIHKLELSLRPHTRTVLAWLGQALGLLLVVGTLHADQAAFEKANTFYKDGKHAEAAEAYLELSQTGVSANLLFNMGNAYFKAGELGRALAAYQRALHLAPRHPDIMVNLRIAQRKALTEPLPLSLRQQWLRKLSLGEWTASASFCGCF